MNNTNDSLIELTPNELAFVEITKNLLNQQNKKNLALTCYTLNNMKTYVMKYNEKNHNDLFIKDLIAYLDNPRTKPPVLEMYSMGNMERLWFQRFIKLNPTQEEMDKAFHFVFQYFDYDNLFSYVRNKNSPGNKDIVLKLLNLNFKDKHLHKPEKIFEQYTFKNIINVLNYSIYPSKFTKEELSLSFQHFFLFFKNVIENKEQINFYNPPQKIFLEFIQKNLPPADWKSFTQYTNLYTPSTEKKLVPESLLIEHKEATSVFNINHSYITHHFDNLVSHLDINSMINYLIDLLLLKKNKDMLNISNILTIETNKTISSRNKETQIIIYSQNNEPVSKQIFSDIFLFLVGLYSEKKTSDKEPIIEDIQAALLYYLLEKDITQHEQVATKRIKI